MPYVKIVSRVRQIRSNPSGILLVSVGDDLRYMQSGIRNDLNGPFYTLMFHPRTVPHLVALIRIKRFDIFLFCLNTGNHIVIF